jgi:O-antigen ligase
VSASLPETHALRPELRPRPARVAAAAPRVPHNWLLYLYLLLLPLQNLQTGYLPNLGAGFNFLNIGFMLALLGAWACQGRIARGSSVHLWIAAYLLYGYASLYVGYANVHGDTSEHFPALKDSMLAVMLVFLVQMSVTAFSEIRRLLAITLVPLPYMLRVIWDQHASVSSWHYSDNLRVSGTFSLLGANEFASFCVTMAVLMFALLLAARLSRGWRAVLVGGIICTVLSVMWSYSRTAYVTLLLGMLSVMLLWRGRWKMVLPLFLASLVVPAFLPVSVIERFDSTTIEEGKRDESTEMRFEFWQIAWDNFTEHPVFGSGYMSFHHHEINPHDMDTHNFFMRELTEKGIVGLAITMGMLLSIFRACWRTMSEARLGGPPGASLTYALGLGMVGVWLALMVANCFGDRFTYYPMIGYFWVYVGLTLKARALLAAEGGAAQPQRTAPLRQHAQPRSATGG